MKLSTIILALSVLTGCAASAIMVSMNRAEQEQNIKLESKPPEEERKISLPLPPPPAAAPAPVPQSRRPELEQIQIPRTDRKPASVVKPNHGKIADDIMSQLEPANLVFGVDPKQSNISDSISITLLIDVSKSAEQLTSIVKNAEIITSAKIEVSKVVIAKVIAPDFNVIAITPEEQPISHTEYTKWEWELIPLRPGKHQIHVIVNAEVNVENVSKVRNVETFHETVEIEITPLQVIMAWIAKYWQWSFSTLILPLGLWVYKKKIKKSE